VAVKGYNFVCDGSRKVDLAHAVARPSTTNHSDTFVGGNTGIRGNIRPDRTICVSNPLAILPHNALVSLTRGDDFIGYSAHPGALIGH